MTFEQWKAEINRMMLDEYNLDLDDIEDWHYRVSFDSGDTPRDAFLAIVEDMEFEEYYDEP